MPTCLPKNHKKNKPASGMYWVHLTLTIHLEAFNVKMKSELMKIRNLKLMKHLKTFEVTRLKKAFEATRHILNVKVQRLRVKGTINSMMKALQKRLLEMGYLTYLDQMTIKLHTRYLLATARMRTLAHLAKLTLVHLGS